MTMGAAVPTPEPSGNDVLDLTGGKNSNEPASTETTTETGETGTTTEVETGSGAVEEGQPDTTGDTGNDSTGDAAEGDVSDSTELYFGGELVSVEVPEDVQNALSEAGIESKDLLSALFKKDGDFSLPDEMKAKLEDKYGKTLVSGYLNMFKAMNEQTVAKQKLDAENQAKTDAQYGKEFSEMVGGSEGLGKIESYILSTMDDKSIDSYNAIMESGDHNSQMLVLSQIKSAMEATYKATEGDKGFTLVGDSNEPKVDVQGPMSKGYITAKEYDEIMNDPKYWEDKAYQAQVESARTVGIRQGK